MAENKHLLPQIHCIGCQACVDLCPRGAVSFQYDGWGEGRADVDGALCNGCGLCERVCPAIKKELNPKAERVYAVISKQNHRTGSSGGVFYELAVGLIEEGGIVFGAAFDSELRLVHREATSVSELSGLCKSKYLHSDMKGVYRALSNHLKQGRRVMFVGTPCQVSGVKNAFFPQYSDRLLLVDFLCHGTGTQRCFDLCIGAEEKKRGGRITDFTFRAKSRRAEHSFRYRLLRNGRERRISGYAFEFPYYHSFLKYNIFNESCYTCEYAREARVGDITLGDFWGIQKHNPALKDRKGVSMISVNTEKGRKAFDRIRDLCRIYEYPLAYAADSNESFRRCVDEGKHRSKRELEKVLATQGEGALIGRMSCQKIKKEKLYAITPTFVKRAWSRIKRGK